MAQVSSVISRIGDSSNCVYTVAANDALPSTQVTAPCDPTYIAGLVAASLTPAATALTDTASASMATTVSTPAASVQISGNTVSASQLGDSIVAATATSTPSAGEGSKGLAGGAVAGVAIGMLLAGGLIAGIVFFFLLRRQKRRHAMSTAAYSRQHASHTERTGGPEKGATMVAASVGSIDDLLPQPAEDDAITGDLSKIRDNVKNHVRAYYHSGPISVTDIDEGGIRGIAALTGSSAATLIKALLDPITRDNALRSIVASEILTRCTGERSPSLLPNEVTALSASISASNGHNSHLVLFSKWKSITGVLLREQYEKRSQDASRAQTFQDTVASLDSILAPFVKGSVDDGQRRKNMDMILTRTANFAFLLFAQPGSFRFDFASHQGGLTVFPALVQTVGDQGQPLNPLKVLTEKEVVAS